MPADKRDASKTKVALTNGVLDDDMAVDRSIGYGKAKVDPL
jgi:hypothetical protein